MSILLLSVLPFACDDTDKESGGGDTSVVDTGDSAADSGSDETGDTNGGTGWEVTDDESAAAALVGATLPTALVVGTFLIQADEAGCPDIVDDGAGTITVTGGCTDASGTTWAGSAVIVQGSGGGSVTYTAWNVEQAGFAYGADGVVNISSTLVFSGDAFTAHYRNEGMGIVAQHNYGYQGWSQNTDSDFPLPIDFSGAATIDLMEVGYSGSWDYDGDCASRPTSGALVSTGTNVATFDFVGSCNDCVPYTTDNGLSGEVCLPG